MPVKIEEYKGYKTIALLRDENDQFPFRFGVAKARLVVKHMDEILDFVDKYGGQQQ